MDTFVDSVAAACAASTWPRELKMDDMPDYIVHRNAPGRAKVNNSGEMGAMSVGDFAKWAGIGRTMAWKQIKDGNVAAIKVGKRTLITAKHAAGWLASRPLANPAATRGR